MASATCVKHASKRLTAPLFYMQVAASAGRCLLATRLSGSSAACLRCRAFARNATFCDAITACALPLLSIGSLQQHIAVSSLTCLKPKGSLNSTLSHTMLRM